MADSNTLGTQGNGLGSKTTIVKLSTYKHDSG